MKSFFAAALMAMAWLPAIIFSAASAYMLIFQLADWYWPALLAFVWWIFAHDIRITFK